MKALLIFTSLFCVSALKAADSTPATSTLSRSVSLRNPDVNDTAWLNSTQTLRPRRPLTRSEIAMPEQGNLLITMKIKDGFLARANGINGVSLLDGPAAQAFSGFVAQHGLLFSPQIDLDDAVIDSVEAKAAQNSGSAQPYLRSLFFVGAPRAATIAEAHAITVALNALDAVEYANVRSLNDTPPPPGDIAPPTADFRPNQSWRGLGSETGGAGIDYAWSYLGRGNGIGVIDIEPAYNPNHEDLVDLGITNFSVGNFTGTTDQLNSNKDHGTKTLGVLAAPDNGYGVVGAAPLATAIGFASNYTDSTADLFITCPDPDGTPLQHGANSYTGRALVIATNNLNQGSVILLEVQASVTGAAGYTPAETEEAVFCTTKLATDAGLIVVGAAGNIPTGGTAQDLDANVAGLNTWRSWNDSGAIIVGAGEPNTEHRKMSYSAYGDRVDVQAWGINVLTTSTGYPTAGADANQSYGDFSGTSSASAVVAATCVAVQSASISRNANSMRMNSVQMRSLLVNTGNPQTPSTTYPGSIGPAVDAGKAIDSIIPTITPDVVSSGTLPIQYAFTGQTMASLPAWDPVNDVEGGYASIDANALLLTNVQPGFLNTPVHAIADWHLSIPNVVSNLVLEFDSTLIGDDFDGAEMDGYLGMKNIDGVFLSNDGEHWTRIPFPGMEDQQVGTTAHYRASLDAVALGAGFLLEGSIRIRFQHYGPNDTVDGDGRIYDNVMLFRKDYGHYEVSVASRNITEGNSASILVGRLGDLSFESNVDFMLVPLTATIGTDLSTNAGVSGTLVFEKGLEKIGLSISTVQDSLPENTETAMFVLKNPTEGLSLVPPYKTLIRIIDNDQAGIGRKHFVRTGSFVIPALGAFPGANSGPAPITLNVTGVSGYVVGVQVKVSDISHTVPALLDIILESPSGSFCKLMSDVGSGVSPNNFTNLQMCFEDGAPALPWNTQITPGTYAPTDGFPGVDNLLDNTSVPQNGTDTLLAFNDQDANGTWKLHIMESGFGDVSVSNFVGGGLLQGGYELVIQTSDMPVWTEAATLSSGASRFSWIGPAGETFILERSSNLRTWTEEGPYVMTGVEQRFTIQGGRSYFRFRRPN